MSEFTAQERTDILSGKLTVPRSVVEQAEREAFNAACESFAEQTGGHPDDMPIPFEQFRRGFRG